MATIASLIKNSGGASFVLQCTIKQTGASNIDTVTADQTTAVVQVDEVYKAPGVLGNLKGKLITVKFSRGNIVAGQQLVVMARPWQYAGSIAVIEIDSATADVDKKDFNLKIANAQLAYHDQLVVARINHAELIVSGRVLEIANARTPGDGRIEGDIENWFEAVIQVKTVEKGRITKKPEIKILFPGYASEKLYTAPKFHLGQEGIWFLSPHLVKPKGRTGEGSQYLTALDPLDFHLASQLDRITALIKTTN